MVLFITTFTFLVDAFCHFQYISMILLLNITFDFYETYNSCLLLGGLSILYGVLFPCCILFATGKMVHLFICLLSKFDLKCDWGRCRLLIIFFLPPLFSFWDLAHNLDKRLQWKYSVYYCQQTIHSIKLEIINSNSLPDVRIHIPPWP